MLFEDIKGLHTVKKQLIHAINQGQVAHAQLFMGQAGSPNLPMALAYAAYLNCENRGEDSCGTCSSCTKSLKYIHPDIHFIFPVSATKNITGKDVVSVNYLKEWRQFLKETPFSDIEAWMDCFGGGDKQVNISKEESRQIIKNLSLKAFEGRYKVTIIWLPEYMHPAAANGILKILEEPTDNTVFLLVANTPEKLLTTITSRTQIVTIPQFSDEEIIAMLTTEHDIPNEKATQLATLADGNINAAVKLLKHVETDSSSFFVDWMRHCYTRDYTKMVDNSEAFHGMNKIAQQSLLRYGLNIMREALVHASVPQLTRSVANGFVGKFSKTLDPGKIEKITNLLNDAHYHLERNASPKITFLNLSLKIAGTIR